MPPYGGPPLAGVVPLRQPRAPTRPDPPSRTLPRYQDTEILRVEVARLWSCAPNLAPAILGVLVDAVGRRQGGGLDERGAWAGSWGVRQGGLGQDRN